MKELDMIKDIVKVLNEKEVLNSCLGMEKKSTAWDTNTQAKYIEKLNFSTPIQLSNQLKELWGDSEEIEKLIKLIVVVAFKLKTTKITVTEQIKDRIYNF